MIPKTIHYFWVGKKPIPIHFQKNIETWKSLCPDYQIIEWNENNYDFSKIPYMKEAYDAQKWGFVPDYARLEIIYNWGGVYLDTDVELIKPLDHMLLYKGFAGFETKEYVNFGQGFGAEKGNRLIKDVMMGYENLHFLNEDGSLNMIPSPQINTQKLLEYGLQQNGKQQELEGFVIFPKDYFNPYDWATQKTKITKNTVSIHHYAATWMTEGQKKHNIERHNHVRIRKKYGKTFAKIYSYCFWKCKKNGGEGIMKALVNRVLNRPQQ